MGGNSKGSETIRERVSGTQRRIAARAGQTGRLRTSTYCGLASSRTRMAMEVGSIAGDHVTFIV
jgi:hypothetical protein